MEQLPPVFSGAIVGWKRLIPSGNKQMASPNSKALHTQLLSFEPTIALVTYFHKLQHRIRVICFSVRIILTPLDWDCASRLYEPACESPASELRCLGSQPEHVSPLAIKYESLKEMRLS
jgi:hypothetical protein